LLAPALGDALDLLNLLNFKASGWAGVALNEEGDKDGPLRMRVDAAAGAALKGGEEQWGAGGWLEDLVGGDKRRFMLVISCAWVAEVRWAGPGVSGGTPWCGSPLQTCRLASGALSERRWALGRFCLHGEYLFLLLFLSPSAALGVSQRSSKPSHAAPMLSPMRT